MLHGSDCCNRETVELRNIISCYTEIPPRGICIVGLTNKNDHPPLAVKKMRYNEMRDAYECKNFDHF
jgi:hypothetical protein